jgi:heterodisulfide reductase subunit A-like polyferredoxin
VPHTDLQTVLVDAERTAGSAVQKLSAVQPPDVERPRASDVDDELDQVVGTITEARIAVVSGDTGEYADLVTRLARMVDDLSGLETDLGHPPAGAPS